jgi:hypothetical protein
MSILSAIPSIVLPFLPTVRFTTSQFPASAIMTKSPAAGVAGRLIVKVPPEVSARILSPEIAV